MSVGEVMDLARDASKALDNIDGAVRKRLIAEGVDAGKDSKEFIDARNEMISEGNFIFFTTADKVKNKDGKESYKRLPIKANQLVGWAKAQKAQYETDVPNETGKKDSFKNIDKDMQFLENLLSGINAVRESGHTKQDTPPYMFDLFGRSRSRKASRPACSWPRPRRRSGSGCGMSGPRRIWPRARTRLLTPPATSTGRRWSATRTRTKGSLPSRTLALRAWTPTSSGAT